MKRFSLFILFLSFLFSFAQEGYSSASVGMGKVSAQQARIPKPEEIHVNEYLNYHKHKLPLPETGEKVGLDLQLSVVDAFRARDKRDRQRVLQIGFTTPQEVPFNHEKPSNICLLVDRSGSMRGERIQRVKDALLTFTESLFPHDIVSLVVFDHEAGTWYPAQQVGNKASLIQAIQRLEARGATNMGIGVDIACQEVMKHFSAHQTNRVIILTDAQVNTGELSPQAILAKHSDRYDENLQEHVDFSLIGVGINFNHDFARTFTQNPHNSIHFIHDQEDIQKVMGEDAISLTTVAARQVEVELRVHDVTTHFQYQSTWGFEYSNRRHVFELKNMNYGLTQVMLVSFFIGDHIIENNEALPIGVALRFVDPATGEKRLIQKQVMVYPNEEPRNFEVERNWAIANLAQALRMMSTHVHYFGNQREGQAEMELSKALYEVEAVPRLLQDKDVVFVYEILKKYQKELNLTSKY